MPIHYTKLNKLISQAREEILFARDYKEARMNDWDKNEQMLISNDLLSDETTRSKITLGKMRSFVNTLVSKIDNTITFKYKAPEPADYERVELLNALKEQDQEQGKWEYLDLLGKEDSIIYGRAIYFYNSKKDEKGEYISNLSLIDPKDFLIDPEAGGFNKEKAGFLGWWGTKITRKQLEKGLNKGIYLKAQTKRLLSGAGNNDEQTEEEEDKASRIENMGNSRTERTLQKDFIWKFYTWITTDENDERYYMLMTPSGECIRCQKWTELKRDGRYPIWTYAPYPNEREFWTPSPCDFVRKLFLGQEKSIRQLMDNSEQINKPQTIIKPDKIKNLSSVKYNEKNRIIEIDSDSSPAEVINNLPVPAISNPINVYKILEEISGIESGITSDMKGVSEEETLGIYEGNIQQASDRIELINKYISEGYKDFAILYKEGVEENLTKSKAVEIIGSEGLEIKKITRSDVKPTGKDYDIVIESSLTDARNDLIDKRNKLTFINANMGSSFINPKVLFEKGGMIVGFDEDDIKEMLDTNDFSTIRIISAADRIFQELRKGKNVEIFREANTGFLQRLNDLLRRYTNKLSPEEFRRIFSYVLEIRPVVEKNMARSLSDQLAQEGLMEQELKVGSGNVNLQEPVEVRQATGQEILK